jgi:hypothetical protein
MLAWSTTFLGFDKGEIKVNDGATRVRIRRLDMFGFPTRDIGAQLRARNRSFRRGNDCHRVVHVKVRREIEVEIFLLCWGGGWWRSGGTLTEGCGVRVMVFWFPGENSIAPGLDLPWLLRLGL